MTLQEQACELGRIKQSISQLVGQMKLLIPLRASRPNVEVVTFISNDDRRSSVQFDFNNETELEIGMNLHQTLIKYYRIKDMSPVASAEGAN